MVHAVTAEGKREIAGEGMSPGSIILVVVIITVFLARYFWTEGIPNNLL